MNILKQARIGIAALAMTAVGSGSAFAEFPERNIENIFPWGPGGAMAVSQIIADAMGEELGVSIPVVSTPGAGGVRAFETANARPADGYTIYDGYVAPLVLQPLLGNADWSHEDFIPLHAATANAFAIIVRKDDERFESLDDLIAYMQENPDQARYTTGSPTNLPHMVLARVLDVNGVSGRVVPYDELEQGVRDLRAGVLDFMMANPAFYRTNAEHVRALAAMSEQPEVSDIYDGAPLIRDLGYELGFTGLAPMGWNWWLVHSDTPPDVVETLRDAMAAALARDDVRERILNTGFVPTGFTAAQYDEVVGGVGVQLQSGIDAIQRILDQQ